MFTAASKPMPTPFAKCRPLIFPTSIVLRFSPEDDLNRLFDVIRDVQALDEIISRAGRNNAERTGRKKEGRDNLVDRAVSADCDNYIIVLNGVAGNAGGVSRSLCQLQVESHALLFKGVHDPGNKSRRSSPARAGIGNKLVFVFVHNAGFARQM